MGDHLPRIRTTVSPRRARTPGRRRFDVRAAPRTGGDGESDVIALAAHVAQATAAAAVADVLDLDLDAVRRLEQDLCRAVAHVLARGDPVLGEPGQNLVGIESLHTESDVRAEGLRAGA